MDFEAYYIKIILKAPLWSCQMLKGWFHDHLEPNTQQPTVLEPKLLSWKKTGDSSIHSFENVKNKTNVKYGSFTFSLGYYKPSPIYWNTPSTHYEVISPCGLPLIPNIPLTAFSISLWSLTSERSRAPWRMRSISYELAAGFSLLFDPTQCLRRRGPQLLPGVLIVQAESNFIDCMCMRHNHIEAILQQKEREQDVVRNKHCTLYSYSKTSIFITLFANTQ